MSILHELENKKYRFVLDTIKNDEQYDGKRSVINILDVYKMCYERSLLMQEVLFPLKMKLGNRIDITDISFVNSNDDEDGIIVKYLKDGKGYFLSISNIGDIDVEVIASDLRVQTDAFKETNKEIILNTFKNIRYNSLDEEITIKSTTGKFTIRDNCDNFIVSDPDKKIFSLEGKYSLYDKTKGISSPLNLNCNYPKLREMLQEDNIIALYSHIHIYEDDFPKELTKKLTYR